MTPPRSDDEECPPGCLPCALEPRTLTIEDLADLADIEISRIDEPN